MLKFLWRLISPDERAENTLGLLVAALSLAALVWVLLS